MKLADASTLQSSAAVRRIERSRGARPSHGRSNARAARDERAATARWLHDRTLQTLEYLAMGGYGLAAPEELQVIAGSAADELRGFLEAGDPAVAADLGAALAEMVCVKQLVAGRLAIELVAGPVEAAAQPHEVAALVEAAGEALANVIRHADADHAGVVYGVGARSAWVEVADDGAGFDPARVRFGRGLRHSVVGRMVQAGGTARLQARPGGGTVVRLELPTTRIPWAVSA